MHRIAVLLLIALAACGRGEEPRAPISALPPEEPTVDGIEYHATSALQGGTLRVEAQLRNRGSETLEVTFPDGCVVLIRAYGDASRGGAPSWDQRDHAFCTMALQMVTLAPGESRDYAMTAEVAEILSEVPEGEYHLTAYLRPDGGVVEVPAGAVQLRR
jgi:hypothetical protein